MMRAELFRAVGVMLPFEGTRTFIPAPPLLHSNQTPVTVLPRLRAFSLLRAMSNARSLAPHALGIGTRSSPLPLLEERSDESDEKDDKENEKQNPRHTGSGGGHTAKSEHSRGQYQESEDKRPSPQHPNSSKLRMNRAVNRPSLALQTLVPALSLQCRKARRSLRSGLRRRGDP